MNDFSLGHLAKFVSLKFCLVLALALSPACAGLDLAPRGPEGDMVYVPAGKTTLLERYAPYVLVRNFAQPYNRIGSPAQRETGDGEMEVYMDTSAPAMYARKDSFVTERGTYTNLIYRVHFDRVPFSLFPFYLSTGRNVGLMVVLTLDEAETPLLVTTVHTCGCYLAMFPTDALPQEAYPQGWNTGGQFVWGENLPGIVRYGDDSDKRVVITVRSGTHRVTDVTAITRTVLSPEYGSTPLPLAPMELLEAIPSGGSTFSLFEDEGARKGYVRGSYKPLELLLVSWWALDLNVGADKNYGPRERTGTPFYTSLKPWNRLKSDMGDFPTFLKFWGWGL